MRSFLMHYLAIAQSMIISVLVLQRQPLCALQRYALLPRSAALQVAALC